MVSGAKVPRGVEIFRLRRASWLRIGSRPFTCGAGTFRTPIWRFWYWSSDIDRKRRRFSTLLMMVALLVVMDGDMVEIFLLTGFVTDGADLLLFNLKREF